MTVVYIDLLFFENFIINYLLLFAAAYASGEHIHRFRLILGAFLGGIYAVGTYTQSLRAILLSPFLKLTAAVLMCIIAYGLKRRTLRMGVFFFACAFAFAGSVFAISMVTVGKLNMPVDGRTIAAAICVMFIVVLLIFGRFAQHGGVHRDTVTCQVKYGERECRCVALIDTGNTLIDPVTGKGVIVLEKESFLSLLAPGDRATIKAAPNIYDAIIQLGAPFRMLSVTTVNGKGMMLVIPPDEVKLGGKRINNTLIGLASGKMRDGYNALVGRM